MRLPSPPASGATGARSAGDWPAFSISPSATAAPPESLGQPGGSERLVGMQCQEGSSRSPTQPQIGQGLAVQQGLKRAEQSESQRAGVAP